MSQSSSQPPNTAIKFKAGDILFREHDLGQFFYVIQEGQVEVFKIKGKAKVPLAVLNPGQCVGEFSALDGKRRSATAIALTEVTAIRINAETLDSQIRRNPAWFRTITFSLVERLRQTNEILRRNCIVDEQLMTMISNIQRAVGEHLSEEGGSTEGSEDLGEALDDLKVALTEAGAAPKKRA
ncbi:MAG TPA: cyclic nucleotide-binding domain-containing protein [Bdellovibrionota bacterium]|nr:cyclic nucleotide-binding domain-containing protein [Bdellovibrionota bacterium]